MKVKCSRCPREHDVSQMEPSFAMPDCIAAMSVVERAANGVLVSQDVCAIRRPEKRGFIRVLLPIPVHGEGPCNWGVWVEPLPYSAFTDIVDAWDDHSLLKLQLPARLANELGAYPNTIGLAGMVSFHDMNSIGRFELLHDMKLEHMHSLVYDQHNGVTPAQKLEWLLSQIHATENPP